MSENNEYITDHPFPIRMDVTMIPNYEPKKMDFGTITVCSKCGKGRIPNCEEVKNGTYKACCESEGAKLIPLRQYTEEVLKVPFNNDKWSFETEDICLVKDIEGIDMNKEAIINKENKKC